MAFRAAVITFPGSNCDRDMAVAIERASGSAPLRVWHADAELPERLDFIALPGGFSYGDYLRSGAMAANSPVMRGVKEQAERGVPVLGVCNGFQVLTEAGLLPGALMRNASQNFICRTVALTVENSQSLFTGGYDQGQTIRIPVAHHDGNYFADEDTLDRLEGEGRVAFRYAENCNGSRRDIAGVLNAAGNVLGMMPHPERAVDTAHGGTDGWRCSKARCARSPTPGSGAFEPLILRFAHASIAHILGRHRPAEVIALDLGAAERADHFDLLFVLHAFGGRGHAEALRHGDHRANDGDRFGSAARHPARTGDRP